MGVAIQKFYKSICMQSYVVDKLSPLMKREVFGGLLEEREDMVVFQNSSEIETFQDFSHMHTSARANNRPLNRRTLWFQLAHT